MMDFYKGTVEYRDVAGFPGYRSVSELMTLLKRYGGE